MEQILDRCEGCIGIADDITVNGHTEAEQRSLSVEAHGSCPEIWVSVQPQENISQGPNGDIILRHL